MGGGVRVRAGTGYHSCKSLEIIARKSRIPKSQVRASPPGESPPGYLDAEELSVGRTREGVGSGGGILSRG